MKSLSYGDLPQNRIKKAPEASRFLEGRDRRQDVLRTNPIHADRRDVSWEHLLSRRLALFKFEATRP